MKLILILMLVAATAPGACVQLATDRIVIRDLLEEVPALQGLDPETPVGFAPLPGTERIISGGELIRIARRHGVILSDVPDVCVQRAVRSISADEMQAALLAALGIAGAQLQVVDFSNQPLPPGRLEFQHSGLNQPPVGAPETPVLWRGRLIYDGQRSMVVWAKVRITVEHPVFVATEEIPAGTVIRESQIRTTNAREFPTSSVALASAGEIIGKVARHAIPSGQRFVPGALDEAKDVAKGDIVHVRVIDGFATLSFDGIAQSSGKKGDTILVHNSASGRNFRAMVEEKGRAVVRPASGD
jgi:flagella basal body P-ring formation protein FlgA